MTRRLNGWSKWLLSLFAAMILALAGWGGTTIIATSARVTSVETQHSDWKERLTRIENKVDALLQRTR